MAEILTPRCPLCDQPPVMVMGGGTQAFCGNEDTCTLICWNMLLSLDDNLMDAGVVKFTQTRIGTEDEDDDDGGSGHAR